MRLSNFAVLKVLTEYILQLTRRSSRLPNRRSDFPIKVEVVKLQRSYPSHCFSMGIHQMFNSYVKVNKFRGLQRQIFALVERIALVEPTPPPTNESRKVKQSILKTRHSA